MIPVSCDLTMHSGSRGGKVKTGGSGVKRVIHMEVAEWQDIREERKIVSHVLKTG